MIYEIRNGLLEIKSSTYPEDIKVIKRLSDEQIFGCVVYVNANICHIEDFEEIDKPEEEEFIDGDVIY